MEEIYDFVVGAIAEHLQAKRVSLMLIDEARAELKIVAANGIPRDVIEETRVKIGEGISGWVAQHGTTIRTSEVGGDTVSKVDLNERYQSPSFISASIALVSPLKLRDRVLGVINVSEKGGGALFSETEQAFVENLAAHTAGALDNVRLWKQLEEAYLQVMESLVSALEAKDSYTAGHSHRVTQYAIWVAEEMGFDAARVERLRMAGLLHDLGKIGIEYDIIAEAGRLSTEQYERMKQHPLIGDRILEPLSFLRDVREIMIYHHERIDGKGFPFGKVGAELPLESKVLVVVDSFDAMTSHRPYRNALSLEVARQELIDHRGTQFDPEVVHVFLRVLDKHGLLR